MVAWCFFCGCDKVPLKGVMRMAFNQIHATMIQAVKQDDIDALKPMNNAISALDEKMQNLLFYATRQKSYQTLAYLIEQGANAGQENTQGEQPIHIAARLGDPKAITLLGNAFVDVNHANQMGQTPLMLAAHKGSLEGIKKLMHRGVNLSSADRIGNRVLHYAVQSGNLSLVQFLLENGVSYTWLNDKHESALHFAAMHGFETICETLIEAGLNPHIHNIYGQTPLHYASKTKDESIVSLLISYGLTAHAKDKFNQSSQDIAKQYGNQDALNLFMRHDTNPRINETTKYPLHEAIKRQKIDEAAMYITEGSKINTIDAYGNLPIFYAIMNGEEYLVAAFINRKAQLEHVAYDKHSALYHAILGNRLSIAKRVFKTQPTLLDASCRTLIEKKCDQRFAQLFDI